jgi:hypothetical protein
LHIYIRYIGYQDPSWPTPISLMTKTIYWLKLMTKTKWYEHNRHTYDIALCNWLSTWKVFQREGISFFTMVFFTRLFTMVYCIYYKVLVWTLKFTSLKYVQLWKIIILIKIPIAWLTDIKLSMAQDNCNEL